MNGLKRMRIGWKPRYIEVLIGRSFRRGVDSSESARRLATARRLFGAEFDVELLLRACWLTLKLSRHSERRERAYRVGAEVSGDILLPRYVVGQLGFDSGAHWKGRWWRHIPFEDASAAQLPSIIEEALTVLATWRQPEHSLEEVAFFGLGSSDLEDHAPDLRGFGAHEFRADLTKRMRAIGIRAEAWGDAA